MRNFYGLFRSQNLEKKKDVHKRLKFLTKLINSKYAMMDYAIWSQRSRIVEEIRFLNNLLNESGKKPYSKNKVGTNDNPAQTTLNSGPKNGENTTKNINNTKTIL
jgi:hypothetical protein